MAANRYGNFLTVLLVIVIIIIIAGIIFLVYNVTKSDEEVDDAIAGFDKIVEEGPEEVEGNNTIEDPGNIEAPEEVNSSSGGGSSSGGKKQYYKGYVMVGYIEISKTGIKYPILEKGIDKALEIAVGIMYPNDAISKINTPGNVVIMGHNFRNGQFFSDNKKLSTGDKIKITGYNGSLTYTIYEIFETTQGDSSFISRDTKGATEITLSTCTDDGARRLIILAKAN